LVGIEACASAHHWSRELQALGHTVRLMPPAYVKPYVKRQKNDATDAEAICEAVTRANMRFVPTKTPEQQSGLVLHRPPSVHPPADLGDQRDPGPSCRVRDRCAKLAGVVHDPVDDYRCPEARAILSHCARRYLKPYPGHSSAHQRPSAKVTWP
jgi:hypothetical protein